MHDWDVLQCVAVCCSVLQCVAVCCSVCCCMARVSLVRHAAPMDDWDVLQCVAVCCSVLQCVLLYGKSFIGETCRTYEWVRCALVDVTCLVHMCGITWLCIKTHQCAPPSRRDASSGLQISRMLLLLYVPVRQPICTPLLLLQILLGQSWLKQSTVTRTTDLGLKHLYTGLRTTPSLAHTGFYLTRPFTTHIQLGFHMTVARHCWRCYWHPGLRNY